MIQHSSTSLAEVRIFIGGRLFTATERIQIVKNIEVLRDGISQDFPKYSSFKSAL